MLGITRGLSWLDAVVARIFFRQISGNKRMAGGKFGWQGAAFFVLCAVLFSAEVLAETVTPEDEFNQRIRTSQKIQPLGEKPFGEEISLYTGALTFRQMDLSLEGLGLPIQVQRTFNPDTDRGLSTTSARAFVDWRLEVPHIETLSANASGTADDLPASWFFLNSTNRCSNFSAAPTIVITSGSSVQPAIYTPQKWWGGYQLIIPGSGRQDLLKRDASNTASPQMANTDGSSRTFPIVTKQNWMVSCLSQTSNGTSGEGFLVVSPEGVKYWMDWLTYRVHNEVGVAQPGFGGVARRMAMMMVSRVEDRFGNSLTYQYASNGDLTSVQASDGRALTLTYETWSRQAGMATESGTRITSATLQASDTAARTWRYAYGVLSDNRTHLVSVTQPDNSSWGFDLSGFNTLSPRSYVAYDSGCDNFVLNPKTVTADVTMRHPSGLVSTMSIGTSIRGRSYVPYACETSSSGVGSLYTPNVYVSWNLVTKKFSGPGITDKIWSYTYSDPTYSWSKDCASGCASTVWTNIVDPDGRATRYTFSNRYDASESLLQRVETFTGAVGSSVARTETTTYAAATAGPWPNRFGSVLLGNLNLDQVEQTAPMNARTLDQDGATYTHRIDSFDAYVRPLSVTQSSPWNSRTEVTAYYDNAAKWVLGQVASSTNSNTGLIEQQIAYSTNAQPLTITQFGKLKQTLTYNSDGTIATVKDGNNNTATLSSWKRGIPQSITYADGKAVSAVVNDNGWITSMTDENAYVTSYGYDAMGRLASIAYPSADSTAWNTTAQTFEPVSAAEYGIATGHWRQTVATGNARKITYFDALFRPLLTREYDTSSETATQRFQRFAYDYAGRTTFVSYPGSSDGLSTGTWTEYDTLGHTTSTSQDSELGLLTTLTTYAGNQTSVTNPRGQKTVTSYQIFDQPGYDRPVAIQHPEGAYTGISRDIFGKPTAITRRNADSSATVTRSYVYDSNQQLCKTLEPESGAAVMAYDGAGNLSWSASGQSYPSTSACNTADVAAAQKVSRSYDARNRLAALTFADGIGSQSWSYTADGLPSQVITYNSNGGDTAVNTYTYNKRRLLTGESISQPGWYTWSLGYGYDANGASSSLVYPSGLTVTYAPNALGQPTQVGTYATGVSYYPNGAIKQFTYGNGIVHTMTQNARQLPTRSIDSGGGNPLNLGYSFDANANVSAITDYTSSGRQTRSMTYDGLDRLLTTQSAMFGGDNLARYSYDVLDNLTTAKVGSRYDYRYTYNANQQLLTVNDSTSGAAVVGLGYDVRGNLANKNGVLYGFDLGNRLRQVTGRESYRYDAYGRRVLATSPTLGSILSFYGKDGTLRYQRDERTATVSQYISLGGSLVAKVGGSALPLAPGLTAPATSTTGSYTVSWTAVSGTDQLPVAGTGQRGQLGRFIHWHGDQSGDNRQGQRQLCVSGALLLERKLW